MHEHDSPTQSVTDKPAGLTHIQVDLRILYSDDLSPTAKLTYGRLVLYAGKNGRCNPSHDTLAGQIRVSASRIRAVLRELRTVGLIDWKQTGSSCSYTVFGGECLKTSTPSDCKQTVGVSVKCQQKEVLNRGSGKDVDIDCPPLKRLAVDAKIHPKHPDFPDVSVMLAQYQADNVRPKPEHFPPVQIVAQVVAAAGDDETAAIRWIQRLYREGWRWGIGNGPRSFQWFVTTVAEREEKETDKMMRRAPENTWDHNGERLTA